MAPVFFGKEDIPLFPRVELSFTMNESHKLMTPLGLHREIHPVMRDSGASWLLLPPLPPPCPPPPHLLALPVCAHPRAGRQKTWQPKSNRKKEKKKGLTWQRAPPWQFNRRAFFGTSLSLHVCPSLCKCHRQSRNAKLLCFPGCLLSCSRTKGDIYINAVPMSFTHAARQRRASCRKVHTFHVMH